MGAGCLEGETKSFRLCKKMSSYTPMICPNKGVTRRDERRRRKVGPSRPSNVEAAKVARSREGNDGRMVMTGKRKDGKTPREA